MDAAHNTATEAHAGEAMTTAHNNLAQQPRILLDDKADESARGGDGYGRIAVRLAMLEEATRIRLSPKALEALREEVETYEAFNADGLGLTAGGLSVHAMRVLLDMYDKVVAAHAGAPEAPRAIILTHDWDDAEVIRFRRGWEHAMRVAGGRPPVAMFGPADAGRTISAALFRDIAHGDDKHRAWLRAALDAFFAGEPVPPQDAPQVPQPIPPPPPPQPETPFRLR